MIAGAWAIDLWSTVGKNVRKKKFENFLYTINNYINISDSNDMLPMIKFEMENDASF